MRVKKVDSKNSSPKLTKRARALEAAKTEKEELQAATNDGWVTRKEFAHVVANLVMSVSEISDAVYDYQHRTWWARFKDLFLAPLW